jgi:tRNA-2-methylthio-N6-dimethylallyladenosine synthase
MCTYCVVPYVRGAERSRDARSILREIGEVVAAGYKEVTLLGQNVDSYRYEGMGFAKLLEEVAQTYPATRIRFSTSHPKDMTDEVLHAMAAHDNICKHIHLPAQSGSSRILELMNRGYDREKYLGHIASIRRILPTAAISTDLITGFCSETEEDHQQTLSLMQEVGYDFAFMFKYSERPGTKAARKLTDDVPEEVKGRRLQEIIDLQNRLSAQSKEKDLHQEYEVLVEGTSKKSADQLFGRNSQNKVVVFPKKQHKTGDLVKVRVVKYTSATLIGE